MPTFKLYKDDYEKVWFRQKYEVEANNLEEAIELVRQEEAYAHSSKYLHDTATGITPAENYGHATEEIYSEDREDMIVYSNTAGIMAENIKKVKDSLKM